MKSLISLVLILSFSTGCNVQPSWKFKPSFYYWKTTIALKAKDYDLFNQLGVKRVYVRFFDVVWDSKYKTAVPNSPLRVNSDGPIPLEIVPVLFLTRESVENLNPKNRLWLAHNMDQLVKKISRDIKIQYIPEIQIDFDWIPKSKEPYFELLKVIKNEMNHDFPGAILSCTIRLHQVKFMESTGVPPVDRGILMVYHTSSPAILGTKNTILDLHEAKSYLKNLNKYPLPLDIALPIFSWAVLFNRYVKPVAVLNDVGLNAVEKNADFEKKEDNIFVAKKDTYLKDRRVMEGDWVKIDQVTMDDVRKTIHYLKPRLRQPDCHLILYHYDKFMIERFTDENPRLLTTIFDL